MKIPEYLSHTEYTSTFVSHKYVRTDTRYEDLKTGNQEKLGYKSVEKDMTVVWVADRVGGGDNRVGYSVPLLGKLWCGKTSW